MRHSFRNVVITVISRHHHERRLPIMMKEMHRSLIASLWSLVMVNCIPTIEGAYATLGKQNGCLDLSPIIWASALLTSDLKAVVDAEPLLFWYNHCPRALHDFLSNWSRERGIKHSDYYRTLFLSHVISLKRTKNPFYTCPTVECNSWYMSFSSFWNESVNVILYAISDIVASQYDR